MRPVMVVVALAVLAGCSQPGRQPHEDFPDFNVARVSQQTYDTDQGLDTASWYTWTMTQGACWQTADYVFKAKAGGSTWNVEPRAVNYSANAHVQGPRGQWCFDEKAAVYAVPCIERIDVLARVDGSYFGALKTRSSC